MFNNNRLLSVSTEKPIEEIRLLISENFKEIGIIKFLSNGQIRVDTERINKFTHEVIIGVLLERELEAIRLKLKQNLS